MAREKILLLNNANLSTGGDSSDVTDCIHKEFKKIAINITKDMGLRICGVDLMVIGDIKEKPNKYFVIEINAAPGLDHYVTIGKEQEKIVGILEEQLSRLGAALSVADAIERKTSAARRSLLHAAFTGNLTKEWRECAHV